MSKIRLSNMMTLLQKFLDYHLPSNYGASMNTVRSYKFAFRLLIQYVSEQLKKEPITIEFGDLSKEILLGYLDWLETERNCSVSTRNQRLAALTSFAKYAANEDNSTLGFASIVSVIPQKKCKKQSPTFFTQEETKILLALPDTKTRIGMRNKLLLVFMYSTGCRAQEACDVKVGDIVFGKDGEKTIVILTGKGQKTRRISLPSKCSQMIIQYLYHFNMKDPSIYLFFSQTNEQMSISCIEEIYTKYLIRAKKEHPDLFKGKYSPHSMRHATATHMLQAGVPLLVIKNFLGHVSINTTQIYAEMTLEDANKYLIDWQAEFNANKPPKKDKMPDFL